MHHTPSIGAFSIQGHAVIESDPTCTLKSDFPDPQSALALISQLCYYPPPGVKTIRFEAS